MASCYRNPCSADSAAPEAAAVEPTVVSLLYKQEILPSMTTRQLFSGQYNEKTERGTVKVL